MMPTLWCSCFDHVPGTSDKEIPTTSNFRHRNRVHVYLKSSLLTVKLAILLPCVRRRCVYSWNGHSSRPSWRKTKIKDREVQDSSWSMLSPKLNQQTLLFFFRLAKQAARRKRNWSDSSGSSFVRADASRWACKKSKRMRASYIRLEVSTANGRKAIRSGRFK